MEWNDNNFKLKTDGEINWRSSVGLLKFILLMSESVKVTSVELRDERFPDAADSGAALLTGMSMNDLCTAVRRRAKESDVHNIKKRTDLI